MEQQTTATLPSEKKKWGVALVFTIVYSLIVAGYIFLVYGANEPLAFISSLCAGVGGFMLATSFSASNFNYFTGWPNMRLGYQKQIGVVAFWFCVFYCVTLLFLEPDIYLYGFTDNLLTANFILGLGAMVIFGLMVAINSKPIARFFAWPTISFFLRLGYWGYAALVVRAAVLEGPQWIAWLLTFEGVPTNRFILSVLAVTVLVMRMIAVQGKRNQAR